MDNFTSQKIRFYSFLSMLLLVFVHAYNLRDSYLQPFSTVHEPLRITTFTEYFFANGIFRFRIPMLFIISGYLFTLHDEKPYLQRIKKRARTLLLPYLIWSAVALLITFVWQQFPVTAKAVSMAGIDQMGDNSPYTSIGWPGIFLRWTLVPVAFQLWFIRCLFMYNLLYPLLLKAVKKIPAIWFSIAGFLWLTTAGFHFVEGEGLFFFSLGIWISKKEFDIEKPPSFLSVKWIASLFIVTCIAKTILAFYFADGVMSFIVLSLLHKVAIFTGLITMWYGCDGLVRFCMERKWFAWTSSFAFIIYALHVPLVNYSTQLVFTYLPQLPNLRLVTFIALPLLIIGVCILFGVLFRKLLPGAYSISTGGRGL